jgi:hypothetical protein
MASNSNTYTKEELSFIKIMRLPKIEGSTDTESRPWLPVSYIDSKERRVTARALYPMGDGDVEGTECPYCNGTGHVEAHKCLECNNGYITKVCPDCNGTGFVDGDCDLQEICPTCHGEKEITEKCPHCDGTGTVLEPSMDESDLECNMCHGTGVIGANGAITVDREGIISLRYDEVNLGIDDNGRIFARLKAKDENGGLGVERIDGFDNLYVKVDTTSIRINDNGYLEVVDYVKPYAESFSGGKYFDVEVPYQSAPYNLGVLNIGDSAVHTVHAHLSVGIRNDEYMSAISLTRLKLKIGDKLSEVYCWDQTLPYTILNFDALLDLDSIGREVPVALALPREATVDSIPAHVQFSWTVNVSSVK